MDGGHWHGADGDSPSSLPGGSWTLIFIRFKYSAQLFRGFLLRFLHCLSYTTPAFGKCAGQEKCCLLEGSQASFKKLWYFILQWPCTSAKPRVSLLLLPLAIGKWLHMTAEAMLLLSLPSLKLQFLCSHHVSSNRMAVNRFIDFI